MKNLIVSLALVVLTTTGFSQKSIKSIVINTDTIQEMTWTKNLDFKTAKDQDVITYTRLLKTNTDFIFDLVGKTVTCIYNTDKKVIFSAQLVKHKTVSKGHFFEYSFDGCITNGKILISENEDGTYSIIRQFASFDKDITTKGEFDRNVKVVVK